LLAVYAYTDSSVINLKDAQELEKAGKLAQASLLYQEWFKANTGNPNFYQLLLHFGEIEENPFTILSVYEQYLSVIKDRASKHRLEQRIALLYELLGDLDQAFDYYKLAFADLSMWKNNPVLLNPAKLLLAQGLYGRAQDWLYTVKPVLTDNEVYADTAFLMTKIYIISQQKDKAIGLLLKMETKFRGSPIIPKCLLELIELYLGKGDKTSARSVFETLKTDYSTSPEYELAKRLLHPADTSTAAIDFYPLPYRFLGNNTITAAKNNKQPEAQEQKQDKLPYIVCVGSFRVLKNADLRIGELAERGIQSHIMEKRIKDTTYFRVVVKNTYTYKQAQDITKQLHAMGYKGSFITKDE